MHRSAGALILLWCLLVAGPLAAQTLVCAQDLNGDGSVAAPGEQAACLTLAGGAHCPISEAACAVDASGTASCPPDANRPCLDDGSGTGRSVCSVNTCFERSAVPAVITDPHSGPPTDDGPRDAAGNCLGEIQIFPGQALRCRTAGTQTLFRDCCKNREGSITDSLGQAGGGLYVGYRAMSAVHGAASAAMTGGLALANEYLASAFDPTTLTITVALALINDLLADQCDERDIESSLLGSSGFCIDLGEYCAEDWPLVGCVQHAMARCCFNSKLARIIHEQGRPQLPDMGGFGTPEEPNCRGFRPEEFQALDFSKIDLEEYYTEIRARSQQLIEEGLRHEAQQSLPRQ